jgi:hypothetical protein
MTQDEVGRLTAVVYQSFTTQMHAAYESLDCPVFGVSAMNTPDGTTVFVANNEDGEPVGWIYSETAGGFVADVL